MRRYDLNLLMVLDALLAERSVSGAARRVGIGQPAMSAALSRLRALFGDPLLVRSGSGMRPTARADAIAGPLRETLARIGTLIEPVPAFDPETSDRTFRVSGGDYVGMTVLPGLSERLARAGRGVDLRFRYMEKRAALAALDDDVVDLALMVMDDLPSRFGSEVLMEETFVGVARSGHPVIGADIDAPAFAAFDHLLVTESGDATGYVDKVLGSMGLSRRVAITVPSAELVADLLLGTNLVATVPRRAARRMAGLQDIGLFEPPLEMACWSMRVVWAMRNDLDPAVVWLRSQLRDVAASL